jgi:hypothetical protein
VEQGTRKQQTGTKRGAGKESEKEAHRKDQAEDREKRGGTGAKKAELKIKLPTFLEVICVNISGNYICYHFWKFQLPTLLEIISVNISGKYNC